MEFNSSGFQALSSDKMDPRDVERGLKTFLDYLLRFKQNWLSLAQKFLCGSRKYIHHFKHKTDDILKISM